MNDEKKKAKNSIRFWPKYERPRELFLEKCPDYVSDAGLIAILLRSGTKGKKVVYLDKANTILEVATIARGTVDQASIYPRELIKSAINKNASAVIFVHNHPSGCRKPSQFDIDITKKLISACEAVDITPLDHIIITSHGHISLKSKGLFETS